MFVVWLNSHVGFFPSPCELETLVTVRPTCRAGNRRNRMGAAVHPTESGWWLSHPSEKYESQLGSLFPNHQPGMGSGASPPQFSCSFFAKRRQNDPDSMRHQGLQEPADQHQGLAQHPNSLPRDFFSVQQCSKSAVPFNPIYIYCLVKNGILSSWIINLGKL